MNIHLHAFQDPDQLRDCLASIPPQYDVRVFDGRYCHFAGDRNTTPAFREICEPLSNVKLFVPPVEILPFGDPEHPPEWRSDLHEKTQWAWSHLPDDEWTLKLDTDERIDALPPDVTDGLDRAKKYSPEFETVGVGRDAIHIARLFVPGNWSPWIDDCMVPRELFPREMPLIRHAAIWTEDKHRMIRFIGRSGLSDIEIRNVGVERPPAYQERRVDHLKTIGREDRAETIASGADL